MFANLVCIIFYKPVVDYAVGTRSFLSMMAAMLVRCVVLVVVVTVSVLAFLYSDPEWRAQDWDRPDPAVAKEAQRPYGK